MLKGGLDGVEQVLITERLGEELNCASLDGPYRHLDVTVAGDEDDWRNPDPLVQYRLQVQAALTGQPDIEHETSGTVRQINCEELIH